MSNCVVLRNEESAYCTIRACLLHFLDMDWRENDLMFLREIDLPTLLFQMSKGSLKSL